MNNRQRYLQIHHNDNVLVALQDLEEGERISFNDISFNLPYRVKAKHKFTINALSTGSEIIMYGVLVGKSNRDLQQGELLTTENIIHASSDFNLKNRKTEWNVPDNSTFAQRTFKGFHRKNGKVGTANYWLVIPLVFCENRNLQVLKEALEEQLGFKKAKSYEPEVEELIGLYKSGKTIEEILSADLSELKSTDTSKKIFKNVDGVKFLSHEMGWRNAY